MIQIRTTEIEPPAPQSVAELEDALSLPNERVIAALGKLQGDILFLGVGGKIGPTMARMAKRASDAAGVERHIFGVSRFTAGDVRERLEDWGIETLRCDLLDERAIDVLPDAPNIVFMAGLKFGATHAPHMAWAINAYLPALVCRRYRDSRVVAFSTGNVYGLTPVAGGGSKEDDTLRPVGEYAMTALGRERMFEYFSRRLDIPLVLLRLNYASELRYGVLVDLARRVSSLEPIDLSMSYVNVIWQADASAMALQALAHATCPPPAVNIAGPEILRIRDVCEQFGHLLDKPVRFTGSETPDALLSDGRRGYELFGRPSVSAPQLIQWTAAWLSRGGETLGKPTHFESRDGSY
jgi:nucleoside-diphosphate-sugar epimerase